MAHLKYFYEDRPGTLFAATGSRLDFGPHLHSHVELVGMLEGNTVAYVESRRYELNPGDIFIVFPNQIHYYESHMDEKYMIFLFPPDILDEFAYLFNQQIPRDAVIKNGLDDKFLYYPMLFVTEQFWEKQSPLLRMQMKGHFLVMMSKILEKLDLSEADPKEMQTVNMILNYCIGHSGERLLLEDVAQALHINKYYISHLFSEKLGMGFGEYVRSLRITQACRLLEKQDLSITDVAYSVGFSSTRTFNRIFIKYVGMTPREYRKNQSDGFNEYRMPHALADGIPYTASYRSRPPRQ